MSALLIITIFLLAAASYSILRTKRNPSRAEGYLPDPPPRSLFPTNEETSVSQREAKAEAEAARREDIVRRAGAGGRGALVEAAETGDAGFYRRALEAAVSSAGGEAELSSLSAYLISHKLRACPALAQRLLEGWKARPARESVPELLRVAALSDDAGLFSRAVAEVFDAWRAGRVRALPASDLHALFDAEYWLLSSEARRSGEGFLLKQQLLELRRRLIEAIRREDSASGGAGREAATQ